MTDETEHPDDSDNVLAFTKRFDSNSDIREMRNLVEAEKPEGVPHNCAHVNVLVDEHGRALTCRRCGAVVDPFDWMLARAKGETRIEWELKSLRAEITNHREGLEKLKREEVNCKGRVRTAQFKLNDINMEIANKTKELGFLAERLEQVKKLRGNAC
ncbi:hypothetical protein QM327_07820 [Pantoea dispersa]|uniref:hypothetical protein n=1 Tax=Pantoea dispersa TaxID=59814 RepID=UPI0024B70D88|nr:hypothetical protein [Pantoea dispersa]MDI9766464.1 hypothetical protein [Pantoea dispersa]